ncbi:MAG TPA: L-threonylcarbamoyladenylate synthase [Actinomycetota bacterium]|nr:L-threonylcarbamoyladenylate synthase [Actinomycetota bacterium]
MAQQHLGAIDAAVAALRAGKLVVMPTDTVYGVAAALDVPDAIAAIFALKGRSEDRPLPVLGASSQALESIVAFDDRARRLADKFWPGPLTLVLPRAAEFGADLGAGAEDSVGVRVPGSELALQLLKSSGPLAVTSANRSGEPAAATVAEARASLGDGVAVYLDEGPAQGTESTVLSLVGEPTILRPGALNADELLQLATS